MNDYQARLARARKLQLAIVAGEALAGGVAGVIVGLIEHSVGAGIIAALAVELVLFLGGSLAFITVRRHR